MWVRDRLKGQAESHLQLANRAPVRIPAGFRRICSSPQSPHLAVCTRFSCSIGTLRPKPTVCGRRLFPYAEAAIPLFGLSGNAENPTLDLRFLTLVFFQFGVEEA